MKLGPRTCFTTLALALALTSLVLRAAAGDDKSLANPAGTWKVTISTTNIQTRPDTQTLKLKLDAGTLTGMLSYNSSPTIKGKARVSQLPITEAKLQGNEISFNFTHPPAYGSGPSANYRYEGKLSGDTIKGTFTAEWMGNTRTKGWQAERLKE